MSFSSFVWNRMHRGMITLQLGNDPCGYFVHLAFHHDGDHPTELGGEVTVEIPWVGDAAGTKFSTKAYDVWVTAKDGFSYVGMVPDDRCHQLQAFDLREGRDSATGEQLLCSRIPVPHRALALFCDEKGDAVFADGHRIPRALAGTKWQTDAVASLDGHTVTPGLFRLRPTSPEQVEQLNVERVENIVGKAGNKVFQRFGCLLGTIAIIMPILAMTSCSFMSEYGSFGIDAWLMLFGSLFGLSAVLWLWGLLSRRQVVGDVAAGPELGAKSKAVLERHLDAKRLSQRVAFPLMLLAILAGGWVFLDYGAVPEQHTGTYEGPSYAELMDEKEAHNNDRGGNHDPVASFVLDTGEVVKAKTTPDEFWTDLGSQAEPGDRYEVLVYPHTRIVKKIQRL